MMWRRDSSVSVIPFYVMSCHVISSLQVAPESQLSALRSGLSAPFELARQHCSYACLFFICKQLNDMGMLMSLMVGERWGGGGKRLLGGEGGMGKGEVGRKDVGREL